MVGTLGMSVWKESLVKPQIPILASFSKKQGLSVGYAAAHRLERMVRDVLGSEPVGPRQLPWWWPFNSLSGDHFLMNKS